MKYTSYVVRIKGACWKTMRKRDGITTVKKDGWLGSFGDIEISLNRAAFYGTVLVAQQAAFTLAACRPEYIGMIDVRVVHHAGANHLRIFRSKAL